MHAPAPAPASRRPRPKAAARGLSRLEFALATAVIGVLAGVLLSRLSALQQATRPARVQAAAASVRAAATAFHARCLAERARAGAQAQPEDPCDDLPLDGTPVRAAHGWPAAQADGIARAALLPLQPGPGREPFTLQPLRQGDTPALRIALPGMHCGFVYVQATAAEAAPEIVLLQDECS